MERESHCSLSRLRERAGVRGRLRGMLSFVANQVPILIDHAEGFHACLDSVARHALRFDGVYYDAMPMSLLLE